MSAVPPSASAAPSVIAIHGGAGTLSRAAISDAQVQAYQRALHDSHRSRLAPGQPGRKPVPPTA